MKAAAKQLEFERAAALRDEIQQIRLRVLEQDAVAVIVGPPSGRRAAPVDRPRRRRQTEVAVARRADATPPSPAFEVTSVTVLPAARSR